jgi:hypothetical protein
MDQTNTYIPDGSNYVKGVFDDWNAMAVVGGISVDGSHIPSGRKKRRKRWAPAATLNSVVLDWNNVVLTYTYQYGEGWGLYRDGVIIHILPSGGFSAYSGSYTDTTASPGTVYAYTMRRDDGDSVSATKTVTTWAHNFPELYDMPESGDVKTSLREADHSNWYLLDGRGVSSLPAAAQVAAIALGYTVNIPDSTDCCLRGSPSFIGEVTGTSNFTLNRNQLPNVTLNGTTNSAGDHFHIVGTYDNGGFEDNTVAQANNQSLNSSKQTSTDGAHTHTFTTESINGNVTQQSIDLTPKSFNVNLFIWLL